MTTKFKFKSKPDQAERSREAINKAEEEINEQLADLTKDQRLHIISEGIVKAIKSGSQTNHEQIDIVGSIVCQIALRLAPAYKKADTLRESAQGAYKSIEESAKYMLGVMLDDIEKEPGYKESFDNERANTERKMLISQAFEFCTDTLDLCKKHAAKLLIDYQLQSDEKNELPYGLHFEAFARLHLAETTETH